MSGTFYSEAYVTGETSKRVNHERRAAKNLAKLRAIGKVKIVRGLSAAEINWGHTDYAEFRNAAQSLGSGLHAEVFLLPNGNALKVLKFTTQPRDWWGNEVQNFDPYIEFLYAAKNARKEDKKFLPKIFKVQFIAKPMPKPSKYHDVVAFVEMERLHPITEVRHLAPVEPMPFDIARKHEDKLDYLFWSIKGQFRQSRIGKKLFSRFYYTDDLHQGNVMVRMLDKGRGSEYKGRKVQLVVTDPAA